MNVPILSALIFVAVLAIAIFIHELGHFIVARLLNVEVEEFGFGLPPRIMTLFHYKGTEFTLNWLPIGGFVRPKGENDPNVPGGLAAASPWTRLAVLLAGPSMNLLLGIVVFSLYFFQAGVPDYTKVQINEVTAASPAAQAGLKVNDVIVTANGVAIHDFNQLHDIIYASLDKPIQFTLRRGSETIDLTATPSSERPQGQGALGILMGAPPLVRSGSATESLQYGSLAVYEQARELVLLPAQLIRGSAPQGARLSGLKGIYDLFNVYVTTDVQSREPVSSSPSTTPAGSQPPTYVTLLLIGGLTVSLGVLNLFPFPALDGGRILFIWPELILRRRVPAQWENGIHAAGMAVLLLFMLYVNIMDFVNPVINSLPK